MATEKEKLDDFNFKILLSSARRKKEKEFANELANVMEQSLFTALWGALGFVWFFYILYLICERLKL